jgi:hypothetical protein
VVLGHGFGDVTAARHLVEMGLVVRVGVVYVCDVEGAHSIFGLACCMLVQVGLLSQSPGVNQASGVEQMYDGLSKSPLSTVCQLLPD